MADYKLGFFGEEIDLKLQQIEELRRGITQLQQNNETITAAIERINAAIEALQNASTGAVRHIQRGTMTLSADITTVSLSGFTNLNKMVVLLNGENSHYSGSGIDGSPYVKNLTVDTLSLSSSYYSSGYNNEFSYQVIEFY